MDLLHLFEKRIQQITKLENFVVMYGKKTDILPDLRETLNEAEQTKEILGSCVITLKKFQTENQQKCRKLLELSKHVTLLMLGILDKVSDTVHLLPENGCSVDENRLLPVLTEISNTSTPCKLQPFQSLTLAEYVKSPYTQKRTSNRHMHILFTDFEKTISTEEFKIVPGYMRGRENLEDIQQFLDTVIVKCFTLKYALIPKPRMAVAPHEMDLWNLYKSQEDYFKGLKFITQGDICRLTDKQIDKKTSTRITILRHLKIIREERKNAAICYIWCKN